MPDSRITIAIVGAGPTGLIAAQELSRYSGTDIHIFEQKPSVARKFLIAGRGGLNLTHSEPIQEFVEKYEGDMDRFATYLERFSPADLVDWAGSLGIKTFKGSSGRIFPDGLKATPLLRAWLKSLQSKNIQFHLRHSWIATKSDGKLVFSSPDAEEREFTADAVLYAMGGGSYPHLGSDGAWVGRMAGDSATIAPLVPSNCGFNVDWSDHFLSRFEGSPVKNITVSFNGRSIAGDVVITSSGLEGGALYALSRQLRQSLDSSPQTVLTLDLKPDATREEISKRLSGPRGKISLSNFLRKKLRLSPVEISLLHEFADRPDSETTSDLPGRIKSLPVPLTGIQNIDRAISSGGGMKFENLTDKLMLKDRPGQFVAGEMLDWEAPTGGYLLQGSFSTGVVAADGIADYLNLG